MPKFDKASRMSRAEEFAGVRKRGTSVRVGRITVAALPGERRRLGIIVTRRVGNAVERNRLKRIVREFFRENRQRFPKGDCVVIPGPGAADVSGGRFRSDFSRALDLLVEKLVAALDKSK